MNAITEELLKMVSNIQGAVSGAFNIRENGQCAGRQSTKNIRIDSKADLPGLDIHIQPGTKGETVYIPACVTHGDIDDLVYNDFFVGEGADVVIIAGCGVHTDDQEEARHNGIHRFFLEKGAGFAMRKTCGNRKRPGSKKNRTQLPMCQLAEDAVLEMDTVQLGGVDNSLRTTTGVLGPRSRLVVRERIMTDHAERALTQFQVELKGEDCGVDLISRSVAKGDSYQEFRSCLKGLNRCSGPFGMRRNFSREWKGSRCPCIGGLSCGRRANS